MKRSMALIAAVVLSAACARAAAATPLKVLTFNLGLLRVAGHDFVPIVKQRAAAAPGEIARFVAEQSVDVVVLEELWTRRQAEAMAGTLEPAGYEVTWPKRCTMIGRESGLLLAVRKPLRIATSGFTKFGTSTFIDSLARKGVLSALIEHPTSGVRFVLLAAHTVPLDTHNGTPVDEKQVAAITGQLRMLLSLLGTSSESGALPALVLGDFNVGPGYADAAYRMIAEQPGVREAGAVADPDQPLITWDPANPLVTYGRYPNEPAAKIDHVFVRDGGSGRWTVTKASVVFAGTIAGLSLVPSRGAPPVDTPLSDHYGILAELELAR